MSNKLGRHLELDISGASHATEVGFRLAHFPIGFRIDTKKLKKFMARRSPGMDELSTERRESDEVKFTCGVKKHITDGNFICGVIPNLDVRPNDYGIDRTIPRPGHADFGQWVEMGRIPTGGGNNSGRMTVAMCAVGGICLQWLESRGIEIHAEVETIGGNREGFDQTIWRAQDEGDSVGGTVSCRISGMPPGIGGAMFEGVESELSSAIFAIPGVKGIEFGLGFKSAEMRGSELNDRFEIKDGQVAMKTNNLGGILGGRTTPSPIEFRVAFRPTPTIFIGQESVDLATMKAAECKMEGRHDPCIVRRAVPVVEAIAAFVMADLLMEREEDHPKICLTLTGSTLEEDIAQYRSQQYFTDMVELRADKLRPEEYAKAAKLPSLLPKLVSVILTVRRESDGGDFKESEERREWCFAEMLQAAEKAGRGFNYIDLESDSKFKSIEKKAKESGIKIIRSLHRFDGGVKNIGAVLKELVGGRDEIAKVAFMPRQLSEVSQLFMEMKHLHDAPPYVVCAMGPMGLATRVLADKLGSKWTYASTGGLEGLGHLTPQELVRDYNFRIQESFLTTLYGVTGWPLEKTRSPELHNAAFAAENKNALMIPFPSKTPDEAIDFMVEMEMKGLAVTIPHKVSIMPRLEKIEELAEDVGAVNTVKLVRGHLEGYNTDVVGFAADILNFARGVIKGRKVAVLGNGGAAKAVCLVLDRLGAKVTVFHRQTPKTKFDIIVNATPVDPIPDYQFCGKEMVYDLRYEPKVTPLMERAAKAGCRVRNGLGMLDLQAREQRNIWGV